MNRTISTDGRSDRSDSVSDSYDQPTVDEAEAAVRRDSAHFSAAMDQLVDKVEESSQKVQATVDKANHWKERVLGIRDAAYARVEPLRPYAQRASHTSQQIARRVRANPSPFAIGLIGLIVSWVAFRHLRNRDVNRVGTVVDAQLVEVYAY